MSQLSVLYEKEKKMVGVKEKRKRGKVVMLFFVYEMAVLSSVTWNCLKQSLLLWT